MPPSYASPDQDIPSAWVGLRPTRILKQRNQGRRPPLMLIYLSWNLLYLFILLFFFQVFFERGLEVFGFWLLFNDMQHIGCHMMNPLKVSN